MASHVLADECNCTSLTILVDRVVPNGHQRIYTPAKNCQNWTQQLMQNMLLILDAPWNRAGHYIFLLFLLSSFFLFSWPNLSGRRLDVCHTSTHLECRSEMCCARFAGNAGPKKNRQKLAIWAPSHNFVGLYPRN